MLELQVSGDKILSERVAQHRAGFEGAQGVEQIERQAFDVSRFVGLGIHVDVEASARIALVADAVEPRRENCGGQQIRIDRAVGEAELEAAGIGIRIMWVRLLPDQLIMFGDHVAPESVGGALMRLYELTVGLVIAARASALPITPPMKL